jgi:hypothetical protein
MRGGVGAGRVIGCGGAAVTRLEGYVGVLHVYQLEGSVGVLHDVRERGVRRLRQGCQG